jgi:hypothetical protein
MKGKNKNNADKIPPLDENIERLKKVFPEFSPERKAMLYKQMVELDAAVSKAIKEGQQDEG